MRLAGLQARRTDVYRADGGALMMDSRRSPTQADGSLVQMQATRVSIVYRRIKKGGPLRSSGRADLLGPPEADQRVPGITRAFERALPSGAVASPEGPPAI